MSSKPFRRVAALLTPAIGLAILAGCGDNESQQVAAATQERSALESTFDKALEGEHELDPRRGLAGFLARSWEAHTTAVQRYGDAQSRRDFAGMAAALRSVREAAHSAVDRTMLSVEPLFSFDWSSGSYTAADAERARSFGELALSALPPLEPSVGAAERQWMAEAARSDPATAQSIARDEADLRFQSRRLASWSRDWLNRYRSGRAEESSVASEPGARLPDNGAVRAPR